VINFTKEECEKIISLSNVLEQNIRDDSDRFISYDFYSIGYCEDYKWIFDRLDSYFTDVTGVNVIKNLGTIHLFDYSVGDKFVRHSDIYYKDQYFNIGVCLNEDYVGGNFVLYQPEYTVLPKKTGEIYTFEHTLEHEVLEVTEGHRWSLIGFYFYEHIDLKKNLI
jgi:hypothetical protein